MRPTRCSHLLLVGLMLMAYGRCATGRQSPSAITISWLRQMHGAVLRFQAQRGQLPDSLSAICQVGEGLCQMMSEEKWKLDAWGHPVHYERAMNDFVLRSTGVDGVLSTADDIVFSSTTERAAVRAFAGCYRMPMAWWEDFAGEVIALDSVPRGEGYRLRPDIGRFTGQWVPETPDSVTLSWIHVDRSVKVELIRQRGSLKGSAWGPEGAKHAVTATATTCE